MVSSRFTSTSIRGSSYHGRISILPQVCIRNFTWQLMPMFQISSGHNIIKEAGYKIAGKYTGMVRTKQKKTHKKGKLMTRGVQGATKAPGQGSEGAVTEAIDSLNLQQFRSIPKLLLAAFMVNLTRKTTCFLNQIMLETMLDK